MIGGTFWRQRFLTFFLLGGIGILGAEARAQSDWAQFGWDLASTSAPSFGTGITAANVASLSRHEIKLDGTVDASAIYLEGVTVNGSRHDVFFVTTTYGKTIAVDANYGSILWEYTPNGYDSWEGSRQITNSTPVADPTANTSMPPPLTAPSESSPFPTGTRCGRPRSHCYRFGKDRLAAEGAPRPHDRRYRRLHRRQAPLPGPRCHSRRGERQAAARLELALQRPHRVAPTEFM